MARVTIYTRPGMGGAAGPLAAVSKHRIFLNLQVDPEHEMGHPSHRAVVNGRWDWDDAYYATALIWTGKP